MQPPVQAEVADKNISSLSGKAVGQVDSPWSQEAYQLLISGMAKQLVINSILLEREAGVVKLLVHSSIKPMMNDKMRQDVEEALSAFYQQKLSLCLDFSEHLSAETPAQYQQRKEDEARAQFIERLNESDFAATMKQNFNAVLLEHSVKRIEH